MELQGTVSQIRFRNQADEKTKAKPWLGQLPSSEQWLGFGCSWEPQSLSWSGFTARESQAWTEHAGSSRTCREVCPPLASLLPEMLPMGLTSSAAVLAPLAGDLAGSPQGQLQPSL